MHVWSIYPKLNCQNACPDSSSFWHEGLESVKAAFESILHFLTPVSTKTLAGFDQNRRHRRFRSIRSKVFHEQAIKGRHHESVGNPALPDEPGDLQGDLPGALALLADQDHFPLGGYGDHVHPAVGFQHVEIVGRPRPRQTSPVEAQAENAQAVPALARHDVPGLWKHALISFPVLGGWNERIGLS